MQPKSRQDWSQQICPGQMARDGVNGMLLVRIPWHFLTSTMFVVDQVRWLHAAAEHRKITKHAHLGQAYQFVPLKQWVLMTQRPQPSSRSLERRLHRR